tara:strand:- start:376 stop:819 length:444 start_codon:yes stop_codon:yes gene_type:complete
MGGGVDFKKVEEIMEGRKYDGDKPKLYLLPPKSILEVGKVLTYGAEKYDAENWRKVDDLQNRYTSAALRHIFAHIDGEQLDEETGLSHLAHAMCCLLFKLEDELLGKGEEERTRETNTREHSPRYRIVVERESDNEERSVWNPEHLV